MNGCMCTKCRKENREKKCYEGIVPGACDSIGELGGRGSQGAGIRATSAKFWSARTSFIRSLWFILIRA